VSYVTLDTNFYRHPKVLAMGCRSDALVARGVYIAALMYARENLTDGFIPLEALPQLDPLVGPAAAKKAANKLLLAGLFTRRRGRFTGYYIEDYTKHQQSKNDVEQARLQAKERKRKQREREKEPATVTPLSQRDAEPVTGQEESRAEEKSQEHAFGLPISISVDKELELVKIVAALKDTDQGTLAAVTDAARGVSFGGIRRVRDSVETRRGRVGVGYAVNALRGERPAA
jgi:hypothetical protein